MRAKVRGAGGMHSDGAADGQVLRKLDLARARRPQKGAGRPKEGPSTQAQENASTGPSPTGRWPNMALGPCARRLPHGKRPRPGCQPEESTRRMLVSKRRVALGPKRTRCLIYGVWAHIDTALGPDSANAATTCGAARYAGKCSAAERVSARRGRHLRRSRQRGCHTDACTEVNIMRAGSNGHAREATKQRQLNTMRKLQRAVGACQCTSRWVPSGEADSGATSPTRALGRTTSATAGSPGGRPRSCRCRRLPGARSRLCRWRG